MTADAWRSFERTGPGKRDCCEKHRESGNGAVIFPFAAPPTALVCRTRKTADLQAVNGSRSSRSASVWHVKCLVMLG